MNYHTIENWNVPKNGMFNIVINHYWLVDDNDNPLFDGKYNSPQCNENRSIVERFSKEYKILQLPIVYIPLKIQDYI